MINRVVITSRKEIEKTINYKTEISCPWCLISIYSENNEPVINKNNKKN